MLTPAVSSADDVNANYRFDTQNMDELQLRVKCCITAACFSDLTQFSSVAASDSSLCFLVSCHRFMQHAEGQRRSPAWLLALGHCQSDPFSVETSVWLNSFGFIRDTQEGRPQNTKSVTLLEKTTVCLYCSNRILLQNYISSFLLDFH